MSTMSSAREELWIRRFHASKRDGFRLVCFPHAGGSASFFFPLSKALSPALDVVAMQYPGRQDRRLEKGIDNIRDLADDAFEALKPQLDCPVALFGHSMGAILAFEVARRIERETDAKVVGLFASGRRAPSRYRDENVHLRDDEGIVAELKLMSGTDAALLGDDEVLRMILPAIRSDYTAIENYRCEPGATVTCPITVLVGDSDPRTSLEEAAAWNNHTTGPFELRTFPGGHFFLAHHQAEIISLIRERSIPAVGGKPR